MYQEATAKAPRCGVVDAWACSFSFAGLVGVILAAVLVSSASAAPGPRGEADLGHNDARVAGELLVDASQVAAGDRVRIGVQLEVSPGWHIYWKNPGDSGAATRLSWRVPGSEVGPVQWPAPTAHSEADGALTTFGYEGDVLLASEAVVREDAAGVWPVQVEVAFLACLIQCVPGRIELADAIPVGARAMPPASWTRERFDLAASRLPRTPEALGVSVAVRAARDAAAAGEDVALALEVSSCHEEGRGCRPWTLDARYGIEAFIPAVASDLGISARGLSQAPTATTAAMRGFSLVLEAHAFEDVPQLVGQRLQGVVPLAGAAGTTHLLVDAPIALAPNEGDTAAFEVIAALPWAPPPEAKPSAAGAAGDPSLVLALVLGLLGGLILNLMPCVLPVLAIKVFAITDLAGAARSRVVRQGVAYLAGVVVSMWALAAVVIALRSAGTAVGWGFQLQNPIFLAAICTVLVAFAMNLFGVFEVTLQPSGPDLGGSEGSEGASRSFFEGTLAVALATPCTAPFLGTAVGFAFASSGLVIVAVFTAIGVGLAAPFLLVALVPGWARFVPRAGAWMLRVRQALAFALLATVLWLAWVAGRSAGVDVQSLLLAYLVGVAFLVWLFGVAQAAARSGWARGLAAATLAFVVGALLVMPLQPAPRAVAASGTGVSQGGIAWLAFDPAAIERAREAGRPVFVDFTADWCITCKVNEAVVLSKPVVRDELVRWNYAAFKADWTRRDDVITYELAEWGRAGVPMYLVYPASVDASPRLLPELLTLEATLEALREAGRAAEGTDLELREVRSPGARLALAGEPTTFGRVWGATVGGSRASAAARGDTP